MAWLFMIALSGLITVEILTGFDEWRTKKRLPPYVVVGSASFLALALIPVRTTGASPLLVGAVLGAAFWTLLRGRRVYRRLPDFMMLRFSSPASAAAAGALASVTFLALGYFVRFFGPAFLSVLSVASWAFAGALVGLFRRWARIKWPEPVQLDWSDYKMAREQGHRGALNHSGWGIWRDELVMSLALFPVIWVVAYAVSPFSARVSPVQIVIASFLVYIFWGFLHSGWLRWVAALDHRQRMLSIASDIILSNDYLQQHFLRDFTLDFDTKSWTFVVRGALPETSLVQTLKTRLGDIESAKVDVNDLTVERKAL